MHNIAVKLLCLFFVFLFSTGSGCERHIAIICSPIFRGETSFAYRVKEAGRRIHWETDIWDIGDFQKMKKHDYDFVLHFVPECRLHPASKNYLVLFHPKHHYFDSRGIFKEKYASYDGYLLGYTPGSNDANFNGNRPFTLWYPTVFATDYQRIAPLSLFYICCRWGNRYHDTKYQKCLELLSKEPYARFYGPEQFKKIFPRAYKGVIPFEGCALYEEMRKAGICLILHSSDHMKEGVPSGRIFEAAATSMIIISDKNPFVIENFGDAVLYVDVTLSKGKDIFRQIEQHMHWIFSHKEEALEKAKNAHRIFTEKFLLEEQLLRLSDFHDAETEK